MVCRSSCNTFFSVHRSTMTIVQRLGTAMLLVGVTGISLSPAAEAHRDHHTTIATPTRSKRPTTRATGEATEMRSTTPVAASSIRSTAAIPRCTAPWVYRPHGWFRFTRITTATGSVAVSGSICRQQINPPCLIESAKTRVKPGATMC